MDEFTPKKTTKSSLQEVEDFLNQKYLVKKIPISNLEELRNDPQVKFDRIVACFEVDNIDILERIFNEAEKEIHEDYKFEHRNAPFASPWNKINSGQLLRIVLESDDGVTLSNFSVQGLCMKLVSDLSALKG